MSSAGGSHNSTTTTSAAVSSSPSTVKLTLRDQANLRRYRRYRQQQDVANRDLFPELKTLVGLAAFKTDGELSTATLEEFQEPATCPGRALWRFLQFRDETGLVNEV